MKSAYSRYTKAAVLLNLFLAAMSAQTTTQSPGPHNDPFGYNSADDEWHVSFAPYLWMAGTHGTVGARGFQTGVHASFGEVFDHLNLGLMGELEGRKKRLILSTDFVWIRLKDDSAAPPNPLGIASVDAHMRELFLTPKVGFRILDWDHFKLDGLAGFRYWNTGLEFDFNPAIRSGISRSQQWADALGGARLTLIATPKLSVVAAGDAGGGGANLDYQVGGFVVYSLKKWIDLAAGYRYLYVNYRNSDQFIYNTVTDGILLGAVIHFK